MKTRMVSLLAAFTLSVLAALPGIGQADDTDLYLRQAQEIDDSVRPNILFVLDNSGSMLWDVTDEYGRPTGQKRIDLLQEALLEVLDTAHNVNVGIERFAFKSGKLNTPILYPVTYIDAPVKHDEGAEGNDVPIIGEMLNGNDDAEELSDENKTVILDDNNLDMTYLPPQKDMGMTVLQQQLGDYSDLAAEFLGVGGTTGRRGKQLDNGTVIVSDSNDNFTLLGSADEWGYGDALIGLRFPALNIPAGAKILAADIVFTSNWASSNNTKLSIYGLSETDANVDAFAATASNLSNRATTTASVAWDISGATWGSNGTVNVSPDLSGVVQQMVDNAAWESGNALGFLLKRNPIWEELSSTYQGSQAFYGYPSSKQPTLRIAYSTKEEAMTGAAVGLFDGMSEIEVGVSDDAIEYRGNGSGDLEVSPGTVMDRDQRMVLGNGECENTGSRRNPVIECQGETLTGYHFQNANIPKNALILQAYLKFTALSPVGDNGEDDVSLLIKAQDSVSAGGFSGKASWDNPETSPNPTYDLSKRPTIGESVAWENVSVMTGGNTYNSADISSIIQAMISRSDWDPAANSIALLVGKLDGEGNRRIYGKDSSYANRAKLVVKWADMPDSIAALASDGEAMQQKVGLRFQNVDLPRGVTIKSARIDFTSGAGQSDAASLTVHGENTGNSAAFTANSGDISNRTLTSASVAWDAEAWDAGAKYSTPDLSEVVQEIVNNAGWCGGRNAMSFIVSSESAALRNALSYEAGEFNAPKLHVSYDPNSIPDDTCVLQTYSGRIVDIDDDAEQTLGDGAVYLEAKSLQIVENSAADRIVGLRFQDIPIRQGATIVSAELVFEAFANGSGDASLQIRGEKSPDAGRFLGEPNELKNRNKTTAVTEWLMSTNPEFDWKKGGEYHSADMANVVQEIVNQSEWKAYNDMAFYISGDGLREAIAFDQSPTEAPVLRITIQGMLGEDGEGYYETVRTYLKRVTREMYMESDFMTPIVDALYEAGLYFRSEEVSGGKDRYNNHHYRISHPLTHDGPVLTPPGCDITIDPYAAECAGEKIESGSHAAYISPISSECQSNHIILLSDGAANQNTVSGDIGSLLGQESTLTCASVYPGFSRWEYGQDQKCGPEWAEFLYTYDQKDGVKNSIVKTHTIGFLLKDQPEIQKYMKQLAESGGGGYYDADSAASLVDAFKTIIAEAMTDSASFASPTISVNAFHKIYHGNEVYFSLFKPSHNVAWDGNVKKYQFCSNPDACTPGEVLDASGTPIIGGSEAETEEEGGKIVDGVSDFWNAGEPDGGTVTAGGAGSAIPAPDLRDIYTNTSGSSNVDLTTPSNAIDVDNDSLTATLLDVASEERDALIQWIRGYSDATSDPKVVRDWRFGDPLHSSPVLVTYSNGVQKLVIGTNDGAIRMLDEKTGVEEWMFIPQELLKIQKLLRSNPKTGERVYGIDGTASILDTGSAVYMFIGMRRGGRNIYALDITDYSAPKLMWTIQGGITTGYENLGQTWSRPRPVNIRLGGSEGQLALVFGGGYDPDTQDVTTTRQHATMGNAIYAADPLTGKRLWWAGGSGSGADLALTGMEFAIPSDLALYDSAGDGRVDRIYVGDTGGQLWRIDTDVQVGGVLARLADSTATANYRRLFYPPDIINLKDNEYSNDVYYDLILIESGERFDPLGQRVQNRLYGIRDRAIFGLTDSGDGNAAQDMPAFLGADGAETENKFFTITENYLFDATDNIIPSGSEDTVLLEEKEELKKSLGWYVDLESAGEKGLSSPVVLEGKAYYTTFVPPGSTILDDACSVGEGTARLYVIDVLTGAPAESLSDSSGDSSSPDGMSKADRSIDVGAGIPGGVLPFFQEDGVKIKIPASSTLPTKDTDIKLVPEQVYWIEE